MTGIDETSAGGLVERRLGGMAVICVIASLIATVFTTGSGWEHGLTRRLIEDSGLTLIWIAIGGRALCSLYTGGRRRGELVTVGPYSVCRHPAVFFTLVGVFGMGAQSGSLILSTVFLTSAILVYLPLIRAEEAGLMRRTPRDFAAYRSLTPLIVPRIGLWRSPETISAMPASFYGSLVGSLPLLAAWPLLNLVALLQQVEMIPVVVRWP